MIRAINFIIEQPNAKHRVAKRFRIPAAKDQKFTAQGIESVLESFIEKFDEQNPDHHYRLVSLGHATFKFVWMTKAEEIERMVEAE